jgi:hypothetical protein
MVAACCGDSVAALYNYQPLLWHRHIDGKATPEPIHGNLSTIAVGHFVGQVFYVPLPMSISPNWPGQRLIWPYGSDFIWPSGAFLSLQTLEAAAKTTLPTVDPHPNYSVSQWPKLLDPRREGP